MYCKKPNPLVILLQNTLIVAVVFIAIDYLYYSLIHPGSDSFSLGLNADLLHTLILALAFGHIYNKASHSWQPNSGRAFLFNNIVVEDKDYCKASIYKIINGIVFSLLVSVVVILAITLMNVIVSTLYIYILEGIRGTLPPPPDSALLAGKLVISGASLEMGGKTEGDPATPPPPPKG